MGPAFTDLWHRAPTARHLMDVANETASQSGFLSPEEIPS